MAARHKGGKGKKEERAPEASQMASTGWRQKSEARNLKWMALGHPEKSQWGHEQG